MVTLSSSSDPSVRASSALGLARCMVAAREEATREKAGMQASIEIIQ